jgi:DNA-binding transcriptional ArsR family regulator
MDAIFKALSDKNRRALMDSLYAKNGQTLGELCDQFAMTRTAVAKHLALLEAANLVVPVWRGREKQHFINPEPLQVIYDRWIGKFDKQRIQALANLKRALEQSTEDPT